MNKIKLLDKLEQFFDGDEQNQKKNIEGTERVLIKLKSKLIKTERMLSECKNETFKTALQLEVDVLAAQIEKGGKRLKELSK